MDIVRAAEAFAAWAQTHPQDFGEWEADYPEWPAAYDSARALLDDRPFPEWNDPEKQSFLSLLARDNEVEDLAHLLSEHPTTLVCVAEHVCASPESAEPHARWQIAAYLPAAGPDATPSLLTLVADDDEYVRRRALLSLGTLRAPAAERCAVAAWESGLEYQRIVALHVLREVGSPRFETYAALAADDPRVLVRQAAQRPG
ncbi:HEAT repeat domain-containing protein [Cellulosimicrobium cellulans]|uniref:HEAT repeat domain-containing protein n=1 Tax=Cellulosimicrobium cellulans TaxID=1710 RepID=UPI001963B8C2|nr:HEAT repeat domain-containing protein [Cellulosimicrobium cellulans]MBN0042103.1 HEAT repeat domain-containing protein [Cellulosimicrobium cellulans]